MALGSDPGIGVIGTGWMAATHTEALRRLGLTPRGVAGRSAASAAAAAAGRLGLVTAYPDVEALLADDAVSVVHVTSPNDVHAEQVEAALLAGKHVVCEKPLGVSSAETARLLACRSHPAGQRHVLQPPLLPAQPSGGRHGPRRCDR